MSIEFVDYFAYFDAFAKHCLPIRRVAMFWAIDTCRGRNAVAYSGEKGGGDSRDFGDSQGRLRCRLFGSLRSL